MTITSGKSGRFAGAELVAVAVGDGSSLRVAVSVAATEVATVAVA
jgi:hypothetical protein